MNKVGERYQIVIDRKVRRELGIRPGDLAVQRIEDGRLVVDFIPPKHHNSLYGLLRKPGRKPITDWQAVKDRAWALRTAEIAEVLAADTDRHREDRS